MSEELRECRLVEHIITYFSKNGLILLMLSISERPMTFVPGREVEVHGLKLFLDMSVGIGGDKWPAADLVSFIVEIKTSSSLAMREVY